MVNYKILKEIILNLIDLFLYVSDVIFKVFVLLAVYTIMVQYYPELVNKFNVLFHIVYISIFIRWIRKICQNR